MLFRSHESARRKRRTAPRTKTGFFEANALRSKQVRAGRRPAASDWGVIPGDTRKGSRGHPELMGTERARQADRVRVAASDAKGSMTRPGRESVWRVSCFRRPARRESSDQRRVGPSVPEWARNGPRRACDPRKRVREVVAACVGQCMTGKRAHDREAKSHGRPVGKPLRHPNLG